jgi:hypothetical protein
LYYESQTKSTKRLTIYMCILVSLTRLHVASEDFFQRGRGFHSSLTRSMCRTSIAHTIRQSAISDSLFSRSGILDLGRYYHNRPPLGWPRLAHAHEQGAAAATYQVGGVPTADWVPRDEFQPRDQESTETQRSPHRTSKRGAPSPATIHGCSC